ncbi:hypothetical protein, partial [Diplocloster agilis]
MPVSVRPFLSGQRPWRYPGRGMIPVPGRFGVSPGAHRAAAATLSEIGKPGSGCTADFTSDGQEPLNREH